MKILAIDTSSTLASVSVLEDEKVIHVENTNNVTHSERLLKLINEAMTKSNLTIHSLDYLITTNGPGSFTGARIGTVTIKGLAFPENKKIIAVSSLEAMLVSTYINLNTEKEMYICTLMDAKNDRAYYMLSKISKVNNKITYTNILEIGNDTLDIIFSKLGDIKSNILFAGNLNDKISERLKNGNYTLYKDNVCPNSKQLIDYFLNVEQNIINAHIKDTYTLDVVYARMSQAERIKNGEKN